MRKSSTDVNLQESQRYVSKDPIEIRYNYFGEKESPSPNKKEFPNQIYEIKGFGKPSYRPSQLPRVKSYGEMK